MNKSKKRGHSKIAVNIFSNWSNIVLSMLAAFFVSPILVHGLGNENYGVWTLIVSITGYFTVLDFGVNTALIRFISKYVAQDRHDLARKIYSNAFIFFFCVSLVVIVASSIFAYFFGSFFDIDTIPSKYLYSVFLIVGIELAFNLLFSVFMGTLRALQDFYRLNVISISFMLFKNACIVIFMTKGYGLLAVALIQMSSSMGKVLFQYLLIKKRYVFLRFHKSDCNKDTIGEIFNYSIYSFLIAVALKVLFFSDSIVIGSFISVSAVTFYAIPMTLMIYLEQFIYAAMSVFTPVISSNEAVGEIKKNQQIYILGSKYSLIISLPVLFVLFTNGDSFISLWMGDEYGVKSSWVIMILSVGYVFYLSQIVANSILKGVSKHKGFAFILLAEALVNIVISVIMAQFFGIEGVAMGTAIPLVVVNLIILPCYVCKVLELSYLRYIKETYMTLLLFSTILGLVYAYNPIKVFSFFQLAIYSFSILLSYSVFSFYFVLDKKNREKIISVFKNRF